ncbi:MAG TPA: geranylgeranylglycerol-phosphate geranylgeranyltransferase [Ignavibacteriaceae bacterium]|nr:geranylgeranylglycerol-phosphate geranylgeranyltransferase [Ignavibacteriaceae bacterium]
METLKAYIKITRPENVLITFLTVYVACIYGSGLYYLNTFLIASLIAALVAAAGNVINDYFDIQTDKINRPNRPLANGLITLRGALIFYWLLNIIAFAFAFYLNTTSLIIVFITIFLLNAYSCCFKKILFLPNITIAFLTGLAFVFGTAAVGNIKESYIPFVFAFMINLIREILKDIEDISGDIIKGDISIPLRYGVDKSVKIIIVLSIILMLLTFIPFIFQIYKIEYTIIIMLIFNPILFYVSYLIKKNTNIRNLNKLSILLKLDMVIGLIVLFFGK